VKKISAASTSKAFDLRYPHCIIAEPYKDVHGSKRWRCTHKDENPHNWREKDEESVGKWRL